MIDRFDSNPGSLTLAPRQRGRIISEQEKIESWNELRAWEKADAARAQWSQANGDYDAPHEEG